MLQGDIGHDLTTINLLLAKHKTLETEILGHESALQVSIYSIYLFVFYYLNLSILHIYLIYLSISHPSILIFRSIQVSISGGSDLIEQGHFGSNKIKERIEEVIICIYLAV